MSSIFTTEGISTSIQILDSTALPPTLPALDTTGSASFHAILIFPAQVEVLQDQADRVSQLKAIRTRSFRNLGDVWAELAKM